MIFVFQVPKISLCVSAKPLQLCPTLCNPVDYSPPGSSVHGILQARILEWVAISFSRGSSWPRNWTHVSCLLHWQAGSLLLAPPGMLKSTHESFKIFSPNPSLPPHPLLIQLSNFSFLNNCTNLLIVPITSCLAHLLSRDEMDVGEEGVQGVEDAFAVLVCLSLPVASCYYLRDSQFVSSLPLD